MNALFQMKQDIIRKASDKINLRLNLCWKDIRFNCVHQLGEDELIADPELMFQLFWEDQMKSLQIKFVGKHMREKKKKKGEKNI